MATEEPEKKILQWQRMQQLSSDPAVFEKLSSLYSRYKFPIEVRSNFAQWIEDKPWEEILSQAQTNENEVLRFENQMLTQLLELVDTKVSQCSDLVSKLMFSRAAEQLRSVYNGNQASLVSVMSSCLAEEERLILQLEAENPDVEEMEEDFELLTVKPDPALTENLNKIKQFVHTFTQECRQLKNCQEDFTVSYQEAKMKIKQIEKEMQSPGNHVKKAKEKQDLVNENELNEMKIMKRHEMISKNHEVFVSSHLQPVHLAVLNKITDWQERQQKAVVGLVQESNLDDVQKLCADLAECIWQTVNNLNEMMHLLSLLTSTPNPALIQQMTVVQTMLNQLIHNSFVIETQPQPTLKIYKGQSLKFEASVRFLIGESLNFHFEPPEVTSEFYGEDDIEPVSSSSQPKRGGRQPKVQQQSPNTLAEVMNGKSRMLYDKATATLSVKFDKMILKKFKRAEKKSKDVEVTDQKYGIVFSTCVKLGKEIYHLRAVSQPMVMIVQSSQECSALATNFWHHAFAESGARPYQVDTTVSWQKFAMFLSAKFHKATGRGLNDEHLLFLARKLYNENVDRNELKTRTVTFSKFCKERLQDLTFTFWKWFFSCLNLTECCLKESWKYGLVHGFVNKDVAQEILRSKPYGTFLLRFSESEIESSERAQIRGALTLAVVTYDPDTDGPDVPLIKENFSAAELEKVGLVSTLLSLQIEDHNNPKEKNDLLTFLYPDKPLKALLKKYPALKKGPGKTTSGVYTKMRTIHVIDRPERQNGIPSYMSPMRGNKFAVMPSPSPSSVSENMYSEAEEEAAASSPYAFPTHLDEVDGDQAQNLLLKEVYEQMDPKILDELSTFSSQMDEDPGSQTHSLESYTDTSNGPFIPPLCSSLEHVSGDSLISSSAFMINELNVQSEVEVTSESLPTTPQSMLSDGPSYQQMQIPAVTQYVTIDQQQLQTSLSPQLSGQQYQTIQAALNRPVMTRSAARKCSAESMVQMQKTFENMET